MPQMAELLYWSFVFLLMQYVNSLNPIVADGNMLFDAVTNERFFVKGLGYYMNIFDLQTDNNELTDIDVCREHVQLIKDTGVNLIRFYYMNHTKNHDECMQLLEKENIYIALDLDGTNRPANLERHYDTDVLDRYMKTIDVFDKYDNVAFYLLGENTRFTFHNPEEIAFFKASIRDTKAYIKTKKHQVLVGYVSLDDKKDQDWKETDAYFNCGSAEERPDFIGLNTDTWCNDYDETSDNNKFVEKYQRYGIPIFMSNFRCNKIDLILASKFQTLLNTMDSVFSGGIAKGFYAYIKSVFKLDRDHHIIEKNTVMLNEIKDAFTQNPKVKHHKKDYVLKKSDPQTCPAISETWSIHFNIPPITLGSECECMLKKLECVAKPQNSYLESDFYIASTRLKCKRDDCPSFVSFNYTTGDYGVASSCPPRHRLSWMINRYYLEKGRVRDNCRSDLI